ncbi:Smoothelin [Toxocara canis]|uniref:Smoothelin n=1 Tax=Toxocara canis TaxID=6265 RepID=A0A0B2UU15_TOXCA|nr:Smoothelin [Toxocara canis]
MRDRSTEIRMLDLQVQRSIDQTAKAAKEFFDQAPNLSREEQNRRYAKLKEEYKKIREQTEEKVAIAETMYTLLEKYKQRLNKEVLHFKYELEADNPGITEQIEKKIIESEKALLVLRKERRRRGHEAAHGSSPAATNGNLSAIKTEQSPTPSRSSVHRSNASVSAGEANHADLNASAQNSRSSFTQHEDEVSSVGSTGGAASRARGSTATQERDPDLPPLKKRSATNPKQLIAITNVASSPALSSLSPSLSEKGGDRWASPSTSSTPPVHSPVTNAKLAHQVHGSNLNSSTSSSNVASIAGGTSMLTFAGQESRHGRPRKLTSRVQEMLKDTMQRHERRMPSHHSPEQDEGSDGEDSDHDNDKRTWCVCSQSGADGEICIYLPRRDVGGRVQCIIEPYCNNESSVYGSAETSSAEARPSLCCEENSVNERIARFATHQLIFAAGSEYFRDYFFSMKPGDAGTSASRPFRVINISEETFEVILNFLYSHQTMHPNLIPTDILLELLHAASQYKMQKLKLACICKIRNMSPEQCIPILQQAIFYKEVVIAERCLMVADENAETILNAESLLDSDSNVLEILIGRETFIPGSELRLFMALLSWSIAKCQRSGLDPSPQNERRVLGNLLNLVDFKALSNDELCDVVRTGVINDRDIVSLTRKSSTSTRNILCVLNSTSDQRLTASCHLDGATNSGFEDIELTIQDNKSTNPSCSQSVVGRVRTIADASTSTEVGNVQQISADVPTLKTTQAAASQSSTSDADHYILSENNIASSIPEDKCSPLNAPVSRFSRITSKIRNSVRRISATFSTALGMSSLSSARSIPPKGDEVDAPTMPTAQQKPSPMSGCPMRPIPDSSQPSPSPHSHVGVESKQITATEILPSTSSLSQESPLHLPVEHVLPATPNLPHQRNAHERKHVEAPVLHAAAAAEAPISSVITSTKGGHQQIHQHSFKNPRIAKPIGTAAKIIPLNETKANDNSSRISAIPEHEHFGGVLSDTKCKDVTPVFSSSLDDIETVSDDRSIAKSKVSKFSEKLSRIVHSSHKPSKHKSEPKHHRPRSGSLLAAVKDKFSLSNSMRKRSLFRCEDHSLIAVPIEAIRTRSPSDGSEPTANLKGNRPYAADRTTRPASWNVETELRAVNERRVQQKTWMLQKNEKSTLRDHTIRLGSQTSLCKRETDRVIHEDSKNEAIPKNDLSHITVESTKPVVGTGEGHHAVLQRIRQDSQQHSTPKMSHHMEILVDADDVQHTSSGENKTHLLHERSKLDAHAIIAGSTIPTDAGKSSQQFDQLPAKELESTVPVQELTLHSEILALAPRQKSRSIKKIAMQSEISPTVASTEKISCVNKLANMADKTDVESAKVSSDQHLAKIGYEKEKVLTLNDVEKLTNSLMNDVDSSRTSVPHLKESTARDIEKMQDSLKLIDKTVSADSEERSDGNKQTENSLKGINGFSDLEPPRGDSKWSSETIVDPVVKTKVDLVPVKTDGRRVSDIGPAQFQMEVRRRWSSREMKVTENERKPKCEKEKISVIEQSRTCHHLEPSASPHQNERLKQPVAKLSTRTEEDSEEQNRFKSGLIRMRCSSTPAQEADRFSEQAKLARKRALMVELEMLHASALVDSNDALYSKFVEPTDKANKTSSDFGEQSVIAQAELLAASRGAFTPRINPNSSLLQLKRTVAERRSFHVKPKECAKTTVNSEGPASEGHLQDSKLPSAKEIKQSLLKWCQFHLRDYPVKVWNFSSCWADGMAFCALAHCFATKSTRFDFHKLNPQNRRENLTLAFNVAEKNGVVPLLEVDDMLEMGDNPDWKCVFVYVQSFYRNFGLISNGTSDMLNCIFTKYMPGSV